MVEPAVEEQIPPTTETPTPVSGEENPDPKPVALSESGNPVGVPTPPEPPQTHDPIPTGESSTESPADKPQITFTPALPEIPPAPALTPEHTPQVEIPTTPISVPQVETAPNPTQTAEPIVPPAPGAGFIGRIKGLFGIK